MAKILLVEDENPIASMISEWLTREKHTVDVLDNGADALNWLSNASYDVAIIDWGIPELSGVDLCTQFRSKGGKTPILMLTGKDTLKDKLTGLDSGADDYLTKPFDLQELSARVRALLRRPPECNENVLKVMDIELDMVCRTVTKAGREIRLAPKEFAILECFMRNPNQVFSSDNIVSKVWSTDSEAAPDLIRPYINRLRAKLDEDGTQSVIETVHGMGYKLATSRTGTA